MWVRISAEISNFSLLQTLQNVSGGPAFYSMGKGGDFTTDKKAMAESRLLSSI